MESIKINTFKEEVLKKDNNLFYEPNKSGKSIFAKIKDMNDLHPILSLSAETSLGVLSASSIFLLKNHSSFIKYTAGASFLMSLLSLGSLYLLSKIENKDSFKEVTKSIKKFDENSDYNVSDTDDIKSGAEYINNINAYVKLIDTNCSNEAIKELREKNLITDNINSWIEGYKKTSDISFLDYLKKNNFNKGKLNKILKAKCYGTSVLVADYFCHNSNDFYKRLHDSDATNDLQDNKIGSFVQGWIGDCWFLAGLLALSDEDIKNVKIKDNQNGSFSVKFKGLKKYIERFKKDNQNYEFDNNEITVTEAELKEKTYFSKGDKDVRILEIACEKVRKKVENISMHEGVEGEVFLLLTGKNIQSEQFNNNYKKTKKILDGLDPTKRYAVSSNPVTGMMEVPVNHALIINKIDKQNEMVTIINPHNTYGRVKLTYYEVGKCFSQIYTGKEDK